MTGAAQTMSAWSRVLHAIDEVPEAFRSFFHTLPETSSGFPYAVFAPSLYLSHHRSQEKIICDSGNTWHVLERSPSQVTVISYPRQDICMVEVGRILLLSWIAIHGLTKDGERASSTIEFNTTSEKYYAHFSRQFRPSQIVGEDAILRAEQQKFNDLARESFKFMNYARSSLTGAEKVLQSIWQPEVRERSLPFRFWPFQRTLTTAHLLILTDQEVILLREDERSQLSKGERYGGVSSYIPIPNILSASIAKREDDLLVLSLRLRHGFQQEMLFASRLQPQLDQFVKALAGLIE
jgi:hypothetical protein